MNGEQKQWQKLLRRECGGVLLEYVLLLFFIITPLVLATKVGFDPSGGSTFQIQAPASSSEVAFNPSGDYQGDFGFVGQSFHDWYQRLISGISLPIP